MPKQNNVNHHQTQQTAVEMDFFYEQSEKQAQSKEKLAEDSEANELNKKTNDNFKVLESEISNTFNLFQSKASSFWSQAASTKTVSSLLETTKNLKIDEKLDQLKQNINTNLSKEDNQKRLKELGDKTNHYLDDLDKELENVEHIATDYALKFGSFLKNSITVSAPGSKTHVDGESDEEIDENESNLLFNVGVGKASNDKLIDYFDGFNFKNEKYQEFLKTFKYDENDEANNDKELEAIYDKLKDKLTPTQFWSIYHFRQAESTRIKPAIKNLNEEEEVNWDDDNDDQDDVKKERISESTIGTVSIDGSTVEVIKKDKKTAAKDEESEDDDDWE